MKNIRKKYGIVIIVILALAIIGVGIKSYIHYFYHVKESDLYKIEVSYRLQGEDISLVENSFQEGSGDYIFLEGLKAYDLGNYYIAQENFEKALKANHKDRALPTYVYFYRNQCMFEQEGAGDFDLVTRAVEESVNYVPLANDTDLLWNMLRSVSLSSAMDKKAIELIESFLQDEKHITSETWVWLKNYIAMLEYNNNEYANSIRHFYDVLVRLENEKLSPQLIYELKYAKEYIANIYCIFEDFEKAALLYEEIYSSSVENNDFDSYGCCINMASAYLEILDTNNARKAMESLEENLEHIDSVYAPEVEANIYDIYANINIIEGNLEEANEYLVKAEEFYENNTGNAFFGGDYFINLTRAKYYLALGNIKDAQKILEEMQTQDEVAYLGLDEEVYDLLEEVYKQSKQKDKLIAIYDLKLKLREEFTKTTQTEYLKFSEYYRENSTLKQHNSKLYRSNMIALISIGFITIVLIFVLRLVRLLIYKNLMDQLTGVYNRTKLNNLFQKYERNGTPSDLAVVMVDVDYFKKYNDTYGHQAGDAVLRSVSGILKDCVRKKDFVIRYGGEEFLILLNGVKKKTAEEICKSIYEKMEAAAIPHSASEVSDQVTMSMGLVYQKEKNANTLEKLIGQADACLYQSKETGRNRLTIENN